MLIVIRPTELCYEIKKSKFLVHLIPYDQFTQWQEKLKRDHPKARHIVYAYRYINQFDQIVENLSDDGEPKASAGPPTLAAIRGKELVNTAVLTVRYFGGIKLGIGGLVRAYGKSVNEVIEEAQKQNNIQTYEKLFSISFTISLKHLAKAEHFLSNLAPGRVHYSRQFSNQLCSLEIKTPDKYIKRIEEYFKENQ